MNASRGAIVLGGIAVLASLAAIEDLRDRPAMEVIAGPRVIPPGRESRVMAALAPMLREGFEGRRIAAVRIEGGEIRVGLEGGARDPRCATVPQGLVLALGVPAGPGASPCGGAIAHGPLHLRWQLGAPAPQAAEGARRFASQFIDGGLHGVWDFATPARSRLPRVLVPPGARGDAMEFGLLTPWVHRTRLRGGVLMVLAFVAFGLTAWRIAARCPPARRSPTRAGVHPLAPGIVVLGAAMRVFVALRTPFDPSDREPGFASALAIFCRDLDTEAHPPVFRALQTGWMRLTGASSAGAPLLLRSPSVLASVLALAWLVAHVSRSSRTPWPLLGLLPFALAPGLVEDTVIARPYGLVALFTAIVATELFAEDSPSPRGWLLAAAAVALALWTDLLAGAALFAALALRGIFLSAARARALPALLLALAAALPLAPGALQAVRFQRGRDATTDAMARTRFGAANDGFARRLPGFALTGRELGPWASRGALALLLLALVAAGARRSRRPLVLSVLAAWALAAWPAGWIALRTRNAAFFPPLVALALVSAIRARDDTETGEVGTPRR